VRREDTCAFRRSREDPHTSTREMLLTDTQDPKCVGPLHLGGGMFRVCLNQFARTRLDEVYELPLLVS
jgi:hypothetical protein